MVFPEKLFGNPPKKQKTRKKQGKQQKTKKNVNLIMGIDF